MSWRDWCAEKDFALSIRKLWVQTPADTNCQGSVADGIPCLSVYRSSCPPEEAPSSEEPDSLILAPCQWNCRRTVAQWPGTFPFGLNAQLPLGTGRDTPIMHLLLIPAQAPASQVNLSSQTQLAFLHGVACFCHCPSLDCELLQVRDCLNHLLFQVPMVRIGTMQAGASWQIFGEVPSKSNRKYLPPCLRGPSLAVPHDQASMGSTSERGAARSDICHTSVPRFPWLVLFQPILTFCLGKSQGNSRLLLEFSPV